MISIKPDAEELSTGKWNGEKLALAKRALSDDGIVVLEGVADVEHLGLIRDRMIEDVEKVLARDDAPFNFNKGNLQQAPPPFRPYLFKDVLFNELIIHVTHAVLGDGLHNGFYSGNTALANSTGRQPVHADMGHLWPNMENATPAYGLVVNFPLVDMDASNGSTEMWPGTHLDTFCAIQSGDIRISDEQLEKQRAKRPPVQPDVKLGSAVIRDIRMWHAGMPNPSDGHRPMIAMIHWPSWWTWTDHPEFPATEKEFFEHPVLHTDAKFVEVQIDHTKHGHSYDLQEA